MAKRYWLMKTEPDTFGIEHLEKLPERTTLWDGVRNYSARNLLRDEIRNGDGVLFYHSSTKVPAAVAVCRVVREGYPDPTQFDPESKYFDPKSDPDRPRWFCVDVRLERRLARPVTLKEMRDCPELAGMALLRRGQRLSVQPVTPDEWKVVLALAKARA